MDEQAVTRLTCGTLTGFGPPAQAGALAIDGLKLGFCPEQAYHEY